MNTLQLRKQLLLAESELNRTQLARDMAEMKTDIRALSGRAKSIAPIVSSVVVLVSALAAFRRGKSVDTSVKRGWLQTILKGAGLISTIWLSLTRKPDSR